MNRLPSYYHKCTESCIAIDRNRKPNVVDHSIENPIAVNQRNNHVNEVSDWIDRQIAWHATTTAFGLAGIARLMVTM